MTAIDTLTAEAPAAAAPDAASFGHRLAPAGDPLEGASFEAIYTDRIEPELVKLESARRSALSIFILALAAGALGLFLEVEVLHPPPTFLLWLTPIAALGLGYIPLARVARTAKVEVIEALCQPLGLSYQLAGGEAPDFATFLSLNLLPHPDGKTFGDFFCGRRADIDFALCEATLTQGSGKNRRTVFQGQLIRLSSPRRRGSTTVVLRNTGWLKRFECPRGLSPVGLEDPRFNQVFAVFGNDQVEAREILTPPFMEQLSALEGAYAGAHIRCGFCGGELLVAFEGRNPFQIGGMFTSLVDRSRVENIAHAIEQVFKLIDELQGA